jgi:hypothetical protein
VPSLLQRLFRGLIIRTRVRRERATAAMQHAGRFMYGTRAGSSSLFGRSLRRVVV